MTDTTPVQSSTPQFAWPAIVPVTPEQAFRAALGNPIVPKVYANTFTNVVSPTDVTLLFGLHGTPSAVVSLSYPVAKALSGKLIEAIKEYEEKTGLKVPEAEMLEKGFQTP
jgi:hypothetical protein